MNRTLVVAKYEFVKTVKRKAFIFSTIFMPIFVGVLMLISTLSSIEGSKRLEEISEDITEVHVVDKTEIILSESLSGPMLLKQDLESSKQLVKENKIDAVIYYPEDIATTGQFELYVKDRGLLGSTGFMSVGQSLIKLNALASVNNPELQALLSQEVTAITTTFGADGNTIDMGIERFIVPIFSLFLFFLSVFISAQYMLQSVAEEKENRMIENLLSMIDSKTLIFGKTIGLSGAVLTQLLIWFVMGGTVIFGISKYSNQSLPLDFSRIDISALPLNIFLTFSGFLLFSAAMTGVGAIGTSYKDSQGLSSIFIILSVLPLYFITILVSDPNGVIGQVASHFPLTSPMVFILRNSLVQLSTVEIILAVGLNIIYVLVAFYLAIKLFNLGSLMYERRPKFSEIVELLKR